LWKASISFLTDKSTVVSLVIDIYIYFPLCDVLAIKTLVNSYLGLKDHEFFSQVEDIFQSGASLSSAEIRELMIANRNLPSRAIKSVITALQTDSDRRGVGKIGSRLGNNATPNTHLFKKYIYIFKKKLNFFIF
jgi:hypothetical protein